MSVRTDSMRRDNGSVDGKSNATRARSMVSAQTLHSPKRISPFPHQRRIAKEFVVMKEFGKRLLVVLALPLWIVIHLIYLFIFVFILVPVGLVVAPLTYLIIGRESYSDWWIDKFDYSIKKHDDFITKIKEL